MTLRLRCEGILVCALIDWPRLLVGKAARFSDFIESVSQFKAILRHSQIWLIAVLVWLCHHWHMAQISPRSANPALQGTYIHLAMESKEAK